MGGIMVWGGACYHLLRHDEHIGWTPSLRAQRLKLIASNRRFTILAKRGERRNLASQRLALVCSDAFHCRHETVRAVARSNGESLMQIKDNHQKGLLRNARAVIKARNPVASKKKQKRDTGGWRPG